MILDDLQEPPLRRHADNRVLPVAFNLANKSRQSLYDALYLALAVMINGQEARKWGQA